MQQLKQSEIFQSEEIGYNKMAKIFREEKYSLQLPTSI